MLSRWANYSLIGTNRWCYNGYYYTAPSTYYPFDENYFYSLPAAHIAGKMANDTDQPASRAIGLAMIDLMREQQNEYGLSPLRRAAHGSRRITASNPATTTPASTRISGWRISTQPKTSA